MAALFVLLVAIDLHSLISITLTVRTVDWHGHSLRSDRLGVPLESTKCGHVEAIGHEHFDHVLHIELNEALEHLEEQCEIVFGTNEVWRVGLSGITLEALQLLLDFSEELSETVQILLICLQELVAHVLASFVLGATCAAEALASWSATSVVHLLLLALVSELLGQTRQVVQGDDPIVL